MTKITVTCDCGCGQTIHKQPNKYKKTTRHFKNPKHYRHWLNKTHYMKKKHHPNHQTLNNLKKLGKAYQTIHHGITHNTNGKNYTKLYTKIGCLSRRTD